MSRSKSAFSISLATLLVMPAFLLPAASAGGGQDEKVPMIFPVLGKVTWEDWFDPEGKRIGRTHHGQDLMAKKLTPIVAAFDGSVSFHRAGPGGHNMMTLQGDNGYRIFMCHINNDTPGTDDGLGSEKYAYAPGLKTGQHVMAGQLLAWVGDSGNAENTDPHCHFELWKESRCINPKPSLDAATRIPAPLVVDAAPELRPEHGEIRLDGLVESVEAERGIVVLNVVALRKGSGKLTSILQPLRRWVSLKEATIQGADGISRTLTISEIRGGDLITTVGPDKGNDAAVPARIASCKAGETSLQIARADSAPGKAPLLPGFAGRKSQMPARDIPAFTPGAEEKPAENTSGENPETENPGQEKPSFRGRPVRRERPRPSLTAVKMAELLNEYRRKQNLPELTLSGELCLAARKHTQDMAFNDFVSDLGSNGSIVEDRAHDAGYRGGTVLERLAVGYETPEKYCDALIARDRDAYYALNDAKTVDVGLAYISINTPRGVRHLWTLLFAKK